MLVKVYAKGLHRHVSKVFWPNPPIAILELPNCLSYGCYIVILMSFQNISSTNYACCHSQLSSLSFTVVFFLIFFVVEVAVFVAAAVFGVSLAAIVVFVVSLVTFTVLAVVLVILTTFIAAFIILPLQLTLLKAKHQIILTFSSRNDDVTGKHDQKCRSNSEIAL